MVKVLSLCTTRTLPLIRRVIAPFSVLTQRGYTFYFQEIPSFDPVISYGYDVTLLHQWVFDEEMLAVFARVSRERAFVYDLADAALLHIPEVQETLHLATLVTVANEYLLKEVRPFNSRTRVIPSMLDVSYYFTGRTKEKRSAVPIVGCFGPHDWSLVQEAIRVFQQRHPQVRFIGDRYAAEQLGELILSVEVSPLTYPTLLHQCWCGLCPLDGYQGIDLIWGLEYALMNRPVITASDSSYSQVFSSSRREPQAVYVSRPKEAESWVHALETVLYHRSKETADIVQRAYEMAWTHRSVKQAQKIQECYQKMLPHVPILR